MSLLNQLSKMVSNNQIKRDVYIERSSWLLEIKALLNTYDKAHNQCECKTWLLL